MTQADRVPQTTTRRRFLLSSAAGVAGYSFLPAALARANRATLTTVSIIVVSDTHLGYRNQEHATRQWEKTVAEINQTRADAVFHLGDVVDGGREEQYPVYLQTRNKLDKPVHEIPGNHDPQALFEKYLRPTTDTVIEQQWLRFILLGNTKPDSHDGFLTPTQLSWLESQYRDAEQEKKYTIVCMHVPAHTNRHPDRGWHVKPEHGQAEFYELCKRYQHRIVCLMHGHFHNGVRGWQDHAPIHEIVFPSALYNQDRRLEEQKAPGYNLPEFRPGFTHVTLTAERLHLRYQPVGVADSVQKEFPLECTL